MAGDYSSFTVRLLIHTIYWVVTWGKQGFIFYRTLQVYGVCAFSLVQRRSLRYCFEVYLLCL